MTPPVYPSSTMVVLSTVATHALDKVVPIYRSNPVRQSLHLTCYHSDQYLELPHVGPGWKPRLPPESYLPPFRPDNLHFGTFSGAVCHVASESRYSGKPPLRTTPSTMTTVAPALLSTIKSLHSQDTNLHTVQRYQRTSRTRAYLTSGAIATCKISFGLLGALLQKPPR